MLILSVIAIVVMFSLVALGLPISFSLFITGFVGLWYLNGFTVANYILHFTPMSTVLAGEVSTLPLFILIGAFALAAGVATDGYRSARLWLGKLPGGLGIATVAASAAFAACSGSSIAGAITMGKLAIPEMKEAGYNDELSAGVCAAGGLLASMIPPSGMMVLYGLASGESIGKLLIAGIVPGLIIAFFFCIVIIATSKFKKGACPPITETITWKQRIQSIPQVWGVVAIFGTIFFGIFSGFFTPNESAAWGALIAMILIIVKARKGFTREFKIACVDSALITSSLFFLVLGAYVFSAFLIKAGLPEAIRETVVASNMPPLVILLGIIASYFILGCIMDGVTIMLLTIPIYFPIVTYLGYDGIWFGVIVVAMIEVGLLTPPFGLVGYTINAIAPQISLPKIFKGSLAFVLAEMIVVISLIFLPQLATWLPSLMK